MNDIPDPQRTAEALRDSEEEARLHAEELQALMEATPAAIWIAHDPDCRRITGSRAAHDLLRVRTGENLSKTAPEPEPLRHFRVFKDGVELAPGELPMQRAARGELIRDFEEDLVFDDGTRLHLFGNAVPLHGPSGEVRGAIGAFVDITQRKQAEERLRKADRRKDEFLAMLAHELRNPLAPIRNAVQVMGRLGIEDAQFRRMRDVVDRQTGQLSRLVDDLLDLSRIGLGKISLRREPLDLRAIVERAVEISRPPIDEGGHRLTVGLPAVPLPVDGDATRLVQVVSNLLNNAAKYTEAGGSIAVTADAEGGEARIRVEDDGIGIAADHLPLVFDLFAQADPGLDRAQGGLGIGLALVRSLVELHGGTVSADSPGPGRGSVFTVRLPLRSGLPEAGAGVPEGGSAGIAGRLRILVVDDNVDSAESLALLLGLGGQEVRTAHDGPTALETAREFQPRLALLDIGLPGMTGYEVATRLRELPGMRDAVLIALTGYGQEDDRRKALDAGFDHHFVKPVDFDALKALINALASD